MQIIPMSSIIWSFTPVCCDGSVYDTPRYILPSISRGRAFNRINKTQWPFRQTVLFSFAADISNGRRRRLFRLSGKTARVFDYLSVAKIETPRRESDIGRRLPAATMHHLVSSRIIRAQRKSRSLLFHGSDRILFAFDDDEFFLKKGSFLLASCSSISEREYHCTSSSYLRKFCLTCFKIIRMDARHSASLIQGYLGLRDHG